MSSMHLLRFFSNKSGVVIGGRLRWRFQALASAAQKIINVDNCQFHSGKPTNVDHVTDAANLFFAADETLDFVCSSHVLEYLANPLKAIAEWKRVIKDRGIIYTGVPDKRYTFDRRRHRTPLSHLIDDFEKDVDQTDKTHVAELVEKWDEERGYGSSRELFLENVSSNPECHLHHHAWIIDDVKEIFEHMGLRVLYGPILRHGTIHIIGQKSER
jgi:predicted SAM-dependent methyltransferase